MSGVVSPDLGLNSKVASRRKNTNKKNSKMVRMGGTGRALYGPFGDLIFTDIVNTCGTTDAPYSSSAVYILREAVNISPISASQSREAHQWKEFPESVAQERGEAEEAELLYNGMDLVTDVALSST